MEFYEGLKYQPSQATSLTRCDGGMIQQIIDKAHARGMKVYFQLPAVQVPGQFDEDMPRLPNGEAPRHRMVNTVSLASDDVRTYICARVKDLMSAEPLAVCADDSATIAATTMRDKDLKWMPVIADARSRNVVGVLFAEDLVAYVVDALGR